MALRNPRLGRVARWIARGLSLVSIALLVLFVVGELPTPGRVAARELVGLAFFPLGVVVGMIVAWRREGLGAAIGLSSLACFYGVYGLALRGSAALGWWFVIFSSPLGLFALAALASNDPGGDARSAGAAEASAG